MGSAFLLLDFPHCAVFLTGILFSCLVGVFQITGHTHWWHRIDVEGWADLERMWWCTWALRLTQAGKKRCSWHCLWLLSELFIQFGECCTWRFFHLIVPHSFNRGKGSYGEAYWVIVKENSFCFGKLKVMSCQLGAWNIYYIYTGCIFVALVIYKLVITKHYPV